MYIINKLVEHNFVICFSVDRSRDCDSDSSSRYELLLFTTTLFFHLLIVL